MKWRRKTFLVAICLHWPMNSVTSLKGKGWKWATGGWGTAGRRGSGESMGGPLFQESRSWWGRAGYRPSASRFPDSVLGSLVSARLGDVTEMVRTFTWPMPRVFLKEIFSRASYLNTPPSFSVEPRWRIHVDCLSFPVKPKVHKGWHLSCLFSFVSRSLSRARYYVGINSYSSLYSSNTQVSNEGTQRRMSLRPEVQAWFSLSSGTFSIT